MCYLQQCLKRCEIHYVRERRLFCVYRNANHIGLVVTKWHCERFHSEHFGFPLSIIIPLTFIDLARTPKMQQSTVSPDQKKEFCIRGLRMHTQFFLQQTTCCGLLYFFKLLTIIIFINIIFFVSNIKHYLLYQYYFSLLLQYASKECVQGSQACLYVDHLQALKSIIARWF